MVRAAVEDGLAHHTPEMLHELMRTGVYKESEVEVKLDRQEKKVKRALPFVWTSTIVCPQARPSR